MSLYSESTRDEPPPTDVFRDSGGLWVEPCPVPREPTCVVRSVLTVPWVTVTKIAGLLWPRMDVAMLRDHPQVRTHLFDTNKNGIPDLHLTTVLVVVGEVGQPVVTGMQRLRDPSIPAGVEVLQLATADVVERAKLAHLNGA